MAIIIPKQEEERIRDVVLAYWIRFCDIKEYMKLSERLHVKTPYKFNTTLYADLAEDICSLLFRFVVNNSSAKTDGTLIDVERMDLIKLSRTVTTINNNVKHLMQYYAEAMEYDDNDQLDECELDDYYRSISNAVENVNAIEKDFVEHQICKILKLLLKAYGMGYTQELYSQL